MHALKANPSDLDYRLTSLAVKNGTAFVSNLGYAYGDGVNLTAVNDNVAAANNIALYYNQANRLQNADGTWGQSVYYYDEVGNRTYDINQVGAVTTTRVQGYDLVSNRLMNITESGSTLRSYTYDGGGNIITDVRPGESFAFTYNKRNRPVSVTRNAVAYASYGYNAFEQLVTRSTSAVGGPVGTIHYIYDLDGHLMAEADAITGATTREYIWAAANDNTPIDLPLAVIDGVNTATPLTLWVHTDHLGRPTRMTDATKATVWQASYKPWGEPTVLSGTKLLNLRFPGQYFQIETGLAYNWNRHYDTTTGRYTQPDPLGFVDGPSVYAYAGNSPWMVTDREGLWYRQAGGAVLGGGANLIWQLYKNGGHIECVDGWEVASWALAGAGLGQLSAILRLGNSLRDVETSRVNGPEKIMRPGSRGRQDHIDDVIGPGRNQAQSQARPGEEVLTEQPLQGHPGTSRRPDNQIVGVDGRTRLVIESERRSTGFYNRQRTQDYLNAGIEVQTRPPTVWGK